MPEINTNMLWKRRIRKIIPAKSKKALPVAAFCFTVGVIFGWSGNSGKNIAPSSAENHISEGSQNQPLELPSVLLGRKKLSIKLERDAVVFKRLPINFEKNTFPPRAPARDFTLVPTKVIERNRANENGRSRYFMLFIVKTSPIHTSRRDVIRKTWGAVKVIDGLLLNTIFVVGNTGSNQAVQAALEKESVDNGDILQIDTVEGYRNLPAKVLSSMQWLISRSSEVTSDFYTFTDDDCVMNIAEIANYFGQLQFDAEAEETKATKKNSPAPSSVKEIQSIELFKKATVNEVTLPPMASDRKSPKLQKDDDFLKIENAAGAEKARKSADADLKENLEIYGEMSPLRSNLEVEIISRNGEEAEKLTLSRDEAELFEILKSANPTVTMNDTLTNYNTAYKENAANLTDYVKLSLRRSDDPTAIFRTKRLNPDTIYCGFSYDARGRPIRSSRSKYGINPVLYSNHIYPPFCHGGMYTMTGSKMASIYGVSTVTDWKDFHLEDVLVTGILREKSGAPDSKYIRRAGGKSGKRSLMYYAWDAGPKVVMKMARRWKSFTMLLFKKKVIMEAVKDGRLISWNNYGV